MLELSPELASFPELSIYSQRGLGTHARSDKVVAGILVQRAKVTEVRGSEVGRWRPLETAAPDQTEGSPFSVTFLCSVFY